MSNAELLPCVEIETADQPTASVIWLHGLGADGNDFAGIVPDFQLPADLAVRFVFPHAPYMPISCNNGYVMRAWYDILHFDQISRQADVAGVNVSVEMIRALIARENQRGVPSDRIILAGFSQGGAIAYTAGTLHPEKLAGIVALSTYLPAPELIQAGLSNQNTPIFAAHGSADPVVGLALGVAAKDTLSGLGFSISWQTWPMQHSVCMPEIQAIGQFIRQRLA
ncbi:alpha/beta hydrolase [Iodobacter fluviatilis]|uniref:Carboxylesterase 2 n=1 Tax=Iodobacter fluviatilis TaxID=537 RepID=A0A377Q9D4_9NEIS|nr:alpha/beta hydrolase [Iodobacter fluviatilis]TCU88614.1 phospholipase/carboxylesterase [Iodobacter fluviatilis]STQ91315.1 Carboxylesterase 2 [Iodobacter fluviatilis]